MLNVGFISDRLGTFYHIIYEFFFTKYPWLLLVFFSVLTFLPMILIGIYNGADLSQHIQFADTFEKAITFGDFYPSWAGDENLGYGSLGVRFYPPLTSFIFAIVHIISGDWHTATWITLLFFTLIGSFGVYLWAKEFISASKAVWAGVVFTLMPYHLHEIYNASLYAEFAGCCLITFSFLFVTKICRNGKILNVLGLAVSYAALILTHLPSTVFGSLMLCLYGLILLFQTRNWSGFIKLSLAVILGLSASSAYWLKMITEMDWLRNAKSYSNIEYFDYNRHFLFNFFNLEDFDLIYYTFFAFLLLVLVSVSLFSLYIFRFTKTKSELVGVTVVFFCSLFMTTPLSKPIWIIMPFLQEVQFPWRLLTISSICGSILLSAGIESICNLPAYSQDWKKSIRNCLILIFLLFLLSWEFIGTQYFKNVLSHNDYNIMAAEKSQSMGFEWFWTTKAKEELFLINDKVIAKDRETNITNWQPSERDFEVKTGKETTVRGATLFYPHWKATVNNNLVEPILADDGAILIPIPAENSIVKLWLQEPFYIILAKYISMLTWLLLGLSGLFYVLSGKQIFNFVRSKQNLELLNE